MIKIPGKIPIIIHPMFWVFAALIGYLYSQSFIGTLIWVGIIFVSVLVHEFGHALTALLFGTKPRIELVALGGLTYHQAEKLAFWKQFLITLNGPVFGFLLFIGAAILFQFPYFSTGMMGFIIERFAAANFFWTIINLVPVLPLDGGQLLRIALEGIFGVKGFKMALLTSFVIAGLISLFFFLYQQFFIGALFFLFAYQGFEAWRNVRGLTEKDQNTSLKQEFEKAEADFQAKRKDEALVSFEKIVKDAKEGMLSVLSKQYLAFLKYEQGKVDEAYRLLLSVRSELAEDAQCLLHKAAFEMGDYGLVAEIGGNCFQIMPSKEVALQNAYACAQLTLAEPAVGWLQTAVEEGQENIAALLKENTFDKIRNDKIFQDFVASQ